MKFPLATFLALTITSFSAVQAEATSCVFQAKDGTKVSQTMELEREGEFSVGQIQAEELYVDYESGIGGYGEDEVQKYLYQIFRIYNGKNFEGAVEISDIGDKIEGQIEVSKDRLSFQMVISNHKKFNKLTCNL